MSEPMINLVVTVLREQALDTGNWVWAAVMKLSKSRFEQLCQASGG
jgi:hypothetical protein